MTVKKKSNPVFDPWKSKVNHFKEHSLVIRVEAFNATREFYENSTKVFYFIFGLT